jgi:hypothetical protein
MKYIYIETCMFPRGKLQMCQAVACGSIPYLRPGWETINAPKLCRSMWRAKAADYVWRYTKTHTGWCPSVMWMLVYKTRQHPFIISTINPIEFSNFFEAFRFTRTRLRGPHPVGTWWFHHDAMVQLAMAKKTGTTSQRLVLYCTCTISFLNISF